MSTNSGVTFSGPRFDPYKLTGVHVTDQELGCGAYATVLEVEYMKLKCAGKKIHQILVESGSSDKSYVISRFEEECSFLSKIRHPNIVQFLGIFFEKGMQVPILVMERLPTNLTSCIERYGILSKEINYSVLHDVALGLYYLHNHIPLIIHRDLSSNNVLLTPHMTAKIADLGVARILNLTPLQISRLTDVPGTSAFMPPEVMIANPKYNTSIDEFSYGILMIHMFSGRWPEPQIGQTRIEADRLIPVTEAERREVFLQAIGNDHPLMDLIQRCINNDPNRRVHANEIVQVVADMMLNFPASFTDKVEMLRHIEADEKKKIEMREQGERKDKKIEQTEDQIRDMRKDALITEQKQAKEIDQLKLFHSTQMDQLKVQVKHEKTKLMWLSGDRDAATKRVSELESTLEIQRKVSKEMKSEYLAVNSLLEKAVKHLESNQVSITLCNIPNLF